MCFEQLDTVDFRAIGITFSYIRIFQDLVSTTYCQEALSEKL